MMAQAWTYRQTASGRRWMEWAALLLVGWWLGGGLNASPAAAQSLVDRYVRARFLAQAEARLAEYGRRARPLPPARLPAAGDSLWPPPPPDTTAPDGPAFKVTERRVMSRLERNWFKEKFGDTPWSFLGASSSLTPLDTTFTGELRARMQAQFGPPTLTVAELKLDGSVPDYIQFEYWFVVNDTIPAMVMDVHGPYDRGLIVAAPRRYRDQLRALRRALLAPIVTSEARAPYVDYFYDPFVEEWYRAGFNGGDFFLEAISRSDIVLGRRPGLEEMPMQATDSLPDVPVRPASDRSSQ